MSDREREALEEFLAEARQFLSVLGPVLAPLAADLRRQENWRIVQALASRAALAASPESV